MSCVNETNSIVFHLKPISATVNMKIEKETSFSEMCQFLKQRKIIHLASA